MYKCLLNFVPSNTNLNNCQFSDPKNMDVFQIESNISSSLVDSAVDSGSINDDITEVCFDTHSEFNLNFFDTPDDSTNQGFSDPDSVESIASISSTPPPPPPLTPAAAANGSNNQNHYHLTQSAKLHQQLQLLQPPISPISVSSIKTGKRSEHLSFPVFDHINL